MARVLVQSLTPRLLLADARQKRAKPDLNREKGTKIEPLRYLLRVHSEPLRVHAL
jgi:hypothetical protein